MIGYVVLFIIGIMVLIGFSYLTIIQNQSFKKDVELFKQLK